MDQGTASVLGSDWWASEAGGYRWYDQLGLPYTETPHIVFRDWFMNLPLVEIRIVSVVLELTVGWHRERTRPLPLSLLCYITKHSKPVVHDAVSRLREDGILDAQRVSRRQPFCYSLIFNRHLNELREAPAPAKQQALPLNVRPVSVQENLTTQPPVVAMTLPLSVQENLTTQPPVFICIKERDPKNTDDLIPPFQSAEFLSTLADFEQHRRESKKPLRPTGRKRLYTQLGRMGERAAIAALDESIRREWIGVFDRPEYHGETSEPRKPQQTIRERLRTGTLE